MAPNWLAAFKQGDEQGAEFFTSVPRSELLLELVPVLAAGSENDAEQDTVLCIRAERLLVHVFVDNSGVKRTAQEFANVQDRRSITQSAHLLASIPDRTRLKGPPGLRSPSFVVSAVHQLFSALEDLSAGSSDGSVVFVSEVVAKFCRRGYSDVVASEVVSYFDEAVSTTEPTGSTPWSSITASMQDFHAVDQFSEALLFAMEQNNVSDEHAYNLLLKVFGTMKPSIRTIFTTKFLLWRTLSMTVLRWIVNFSVLCRPSDKCEPHVQKDVVKSLAEAWAELSYIQSTAIEQQAYLTAAIGISIKAMNKEDISVVVKYLLDGISRRLESPLPQVRRMAKQIALAFSTVMNPENPLLLDDQDSIEDLQKWDVIEQQHSHSTCTERQEAKPVRRSTKSNINLDPDAIVDLTNLEPKSWNDDDDSGSEGSLEPYDMSDDDFDLERTKYPSQLSECIASLRKDEPDAVERALDVCESLVRFMPDELDYWASDLVHALINVRCSDVAVEGEEETAEAKRRAALVSVLVCSPLPSAAALGTLLYSAHVDVSHRLLILDVLSDGAKELASGTPPPEANAKQLAGPWKEVPRHMPENSLIPCFQVFERELPPKAGQKMVGKTRRWAKRSSQTVSTAPRKNNFAPVASVFMLPVMRDHDKRSHGVDFLGKDYVVLGRLIYMLGVCMECTAFQPEAPALASNLLEMLRSRPIATHPERYVRSAVLFAGSRVLTALHPSQVMGMEGSLAEGLEWLWEWASSVAQRSSDATDSKMAIACLQLQSEMAYQSTRSIPKAPWILELP